MSEVLDGALQRLLQALRRPVAVGAAEGPQLLLVAADLRLPPRRHEEQGQQRHETDQHREQADHPAEPLRGLPAAKAEGAGRVQTLAE